MKLSALGRPGPERASGKRRGRGDAFEPDESRWVRSDRDCPATRHTAATPDAARLIVMRGQAGQAGPGRRSGTLVVPTYVARPTHGDKSPR